MPLMPLIKLNKRQFMKFLEMLLIPESILTNHTFLKQLHQRNLLQKKLVLKDNKRFHQFQMIQKISLRMDQL